MYLSPPNNNPGEGLWETPRRMRCAKFVRRVVMPDALIGQLGPSISICGRQLYPDWQDVNVDQEVEITIFLMIIRM